jgi:hypothetical protein
LLTFGIDTFPNHSGFTLNELMAKGVPVLTKWSESIDANWEMRIPDLIFQTEDDLIEFVVDSNNQPSSYAKWCQRSKEFISSKERHKEFAQIMVKEITGLTN